MSNKRDREKELNDINIVAMTVLEDELIQYIKSSDLHMKEILIILKRKNGVELKTMKQENKRVCKDLYK